MNTQQARLVGICVSFLLAIIVGTLTGWIASDRNSDSVVTPNRETSTTQAPATKDTPSKLPPVPSVKPKILPSVGPSKSDPPPIPNASPQPTASVSTPPSQSSKTGTSPQQTSAAKQPETAATTSSTPASAAANFTGELAGYTTDATGEPLSSWVSFSLPAAAVSFLGALLTGLAMVALFSAVARRNQAAQARLSGLAHPSPAASDVGSAGTYVLSTADSVATVGSSQERDQLVETLIYVRDRATSSAINDRVGAALSAAGVIELNPTGQRFDATSHEAGGTEPTDNPQVHGIIAGVEVAGYADRDGRTLRVPIVTVYQHSVGRANV
ncbi:MAG: hypothetical protein ACR2JX_07595 [Mycobacteriales bacterium]